MKLLIIWVILLISFVFPAHADDEAEFNAFTKDVLIAARAQYPDLKIEQTDTDEITYQEKTNKSADGVGRIYTWTLYNQYLKDPATKGDLINRFLTAMPLDGDIDTSDATNRIVFVLRPYSYFQGLSSDLVEDIDTLIYRDFTEGMIAMLMLDSPEALSSASRGMLEDNDLSVDEAFVLAEANTRRLMGEIYIEDIEGIDVMSSENALISGLPLLPESCTKETPTYAAFLLERNTLFKASLEGEGEAVSTLMNFAANVIPTGESLAEGVLLCCEGEWAYAVPTLSEE